MNIDTAKEPWEIRKQIDYSNLTMNGVVLPAVYVKSRFERKTDNPAFQHIIDCLSEQPQPGFFFTPNQSGDLFLRVRPRINRHGILKSEIFRDSSGQIYRDIDVKGIGYVQGFPMRVLRIQESHMEGDMELRGIYHYHFAHEDWMNTEELASLGLRVAKNVAQVELLELVDVIDKGLKKIGAVERQAVGDRLGVNMDKVRPLAHIRAMGTTARVMDLPLEHTEENHTYRGYLKEIVDDAIGLVSLELGNTLTPIDYSVWFIEKLGSMLGYMHSKYISPDFRKQIHLGTHNVTLDCRLLDTHAYDTPLGIKREREHILKQIKEKPELRGWMKDKYVHSREEVEENNAKVERLDAQLSIKILENLVYGVGRIYNLGNLDKEISKRFGAAYGKTYVPIRRREA